MGASRNISDARIEGMSQESQAMIGLQAGSNKGASQAGKLLEWSDQISCYTPNENIHFVVTHL